MTAITPYLYIGDVTHASNLGWLQKHKIDVIVNAAKELPNFHSGMFQYARTDWEDTLDQFMMDELDQIADFIISSMQQRKKKVLVHCAAGISRSSTIIIAVLMKMNGWSYDRAFSFLKSLHQRANPNFGFQEQLKQWESGYPNQEETYYDSKELDTISPPQGGEIVPPPQGGWSSLTMDCPECERPQYEKSSKGKGMYAKIFS